MYTSLARSKTPINEAANLKSLTSAGAAALKAEVAKVHRATRGHSALRARGEISKAKYKLAQFRDIGSLEDAFVAVQKRRDGERLVPIALEIENRRAVRRGYSEVQAEQKWMRESNVSRMIKEGEAIIANTIKGVFPVRDLTKAKGKKR